MGEDGDRIARVIEKQRSGQVNGIQGFQLLGHGTGALDHVVIDGHQFHAVEEFLSDGQR